MNEIEKIFGAYIRFPQVAGSIEFNYSEIAILKHYPDMAEVDYPYFTSRNHSTRYFERGMLDKEYKITDELTRYYSSEKQKCIDWLDSKREDLIKCCKFDYDRLLKSEVKEVEIKL